MYVCIYIYIYLCFFVRLLLLFCLGFIGFRIPSQLPQGTTRDDSRHVNGPLILRLIKGLLLQAPPTKPNPIPRAKLYPKACKPRSTLSPKPGRPPRNLLRPDATTKQVSLAVLTLFVEKAVQASLQHLTSARQWKLTRQSTKPPSQKHEQLLTTSSAIPTLQ